ncbi:uncharacterized protein [Drosophila pseudoobscura]|uniref:Uncharacterized protein n=1 Tax=Drosophila pseudoobscura pseudoobscura TaxID=46245 RepID=A0A6I8VPN3_DROPS|nr:uncharacterized protein LOC117183376 [Drosophila pseudoobscura]
MPVDVDVDVEMRMRMCGAQADNRSSGPMVERQAVSQSVALAVALLEWIVSQQRFNVAHIIHSHLMTRRRRPTGTDSRNSSAAVNLLALADDHSLRGPGAVYIYAEYAVCRVQMQSQTQIQTHTQTPVRATVKIC